MTVSNQAKTRRQSSSRWLLAAIVIVVIVLISAAAAGRILDQTASRAAPLPATAKVARGDLVSRVDGSGSVGAEQTVNLPFLLSGAVTDVLVKEGDTVEAGQVLAKLDDRSLQLQLTSARAALDSARARLAEAQAGNARPQDLAAAQAQVAAAQATLDKVTRGGSSADLASAQAAVRSAQAAYDAANNTAGTSNAQFRTATAAFEKAQAALQQAQAAYDKVAGAPNVGALPQSLQLQMATTDYEQAKANYDALSKTANSDAQARVNSAAAQLAQARAALTKLTPTNDDVSVAQANLDAAQANLARLTAPATENDLKIQQAAVTQAESQLSQAQLALDNATLKAPFAGVVAQVSIVPGSVVSPAAPAVRLIDRNPLHVDVRLSESDVADVQLGQPVTLTFSTLDGWQTTGQVSYIAPAADTTNGVVTYPVRVTFAGDEPRVKIGMTSDLEIVTAARHAALLVPDNALLPKGSGRAAQVIKTNALGQSTVEEVAVQTGLSDGTQTEVVGGLTEGQAIVALPYHRVSRPARGLFGR